jgi:hypothetical protein
MYYTCPLHTEKMKIQWKTIEITIFSLVGVKTQKREKTQRSADTAILLVVLHFLIIVGLLFIIINVMGRPARG